MNTMSPWVRPVGSIILALALAVCSGCHSSMGSARSEKSLAKLQARAEKGSPQTQFELGEIYATGDGVPRSDEEALRWFSRAAERGHAEAQYNLGLMFKDGRGVKKDYVQSYKWLSLSAARGNVNASMRMDALGQLMSREQIMEAQRDAGAFTTRKKLPPEQLPTPPPPTAP